MTSAAIISTLDRVRVLESFTPSSGTASDQLACSVAFDSSPEYIVRLLKRIQVANALQPSLIPPDLVTMNSVVRVIDEETLEEDAYTLVYPHEIEADTNFLTIHSKLGSELFGRRVGDEIQLNQRWGKHKLRIKSLDYQPESAGHFDR